MRLFKQRSGWLMAIFFMCCQLPIFASTCIITNIHWYYYTEEGIVRGVSEFVICYPTGTSGTGTSTGEDEGGQTSTGGSNPPPPVPDCVVSNGDQFVSSPAEVIESTGSRPFGADPQSPNQFHSGLDLFAANGTPIYAPCDGKIIYAYDRVPRNVNIATTGDSGQIGNSIVIQPYGSEEFEPESRSYIPAMDAAYHVVLEHLDPGFTEQLGVRSGIHIQKGELIGFSDNTGQSTIDPHLHLGVKDGSNNMLDPLEVMDCEEVPQ